MSISWSRQSQLEFPSDRNRGLTYSSYEIVEKHVPRGHNVVKETSAAAFAPMWCPTT